MKNRRKTRVRIGLALLAASGAIFLPAAARLRADASGRTQLSSPFTRQILSTSAEAPLALRFFTTAVKTDSRGRVITGTTSDPVKNIVGPESAGERGGMQRFTKIMFGADYINGRPDPGTRIDPNNPQVKSGSQVWPNREQPFRSQPRSLALTPDGRKLYVALPGREGYPDWRVSVVDTVGRRVTKWIDLRPAGVAAGLRPISVKISPLNPAIYPRPYAIVLNQYANFASVIDTGTDTIIGDFQTSTYAEKALFNSDGTRLYVTDRFKDVVRAFRVSPGPVFTQIAEIPTGTTELERANPRDLDLSADGRTLYVANTLGHTIAAINVANDANTLTKNLIVGGLSTDVKIAGRWGIVCGQETNTKLNERETGHGVPTTNANGVAIKNNGQPLGYTPVMADATKATTFDDIGSELNVFDTTTNLFVYRYVDKGRDFSQLVTPGQIVDLHDHADAQKIIRGSGPEQMTIKNGLLFVTMLHSDKVEVFRINQSPSDVSGILSPLGFEFTGGITPEGVEVSPDGRTVYTANLQTEDISFLTVDQNGALTRQGYLAVGVTPGTPDPVKGGTGAGLFATDEEVGLRWFFSSAYADDGPVAGITPGGFDPQKSCGFCHWDARQDGCQWNVAANAVGGVKVCPQNKDISDNWPEWYEGLNNDFMAYASACNGEVLLGERGPTPLFPQANQADRMHAREDYVLRKTEENSRAIGRPELNGKAFKVGYNDLAYLQILWSQNETRLFPNPLAQVPTQDEAAQVERGRQIFTGKVSEGGAGCADCHHNGNSLANGVPNDTFQDFNIHEPGVISESTVDGKGPFFRPENDYFFEPFAPPQDVGTPQNFSSRNTKHLRALWDAVPKYLHYGFAHTLREVLLAPDSPLLRPGERGFNFRTVRLDQSRPTATSFLGGPPVVLPTQVPITFADSSGSLAGDGKGQILVSLDSPFATEPDGTAQIDRLGTSNLMPLMSGNQINPALAANNIQVIRDTHGKTSHLSAADLDALILYLKSLDRKTAGAISIPEDGGPGPSPTPTVSPSATPTPSPGPSVTATPSPGATSSPSATASASASPSATPSVSPKKSGGRALNISTRLKVESGDNAMIGGFIVTGNAPKKLLVRAIGPSLSQVGISGALSDPVLELHGDGGTLLSANDNWKDDPAAAEAIRQSGAAPQNERESAVVVTLAPGSYTAVVSGKNGATGTGLIEIYDLEETGDCELANISTRGLVQSGEDVMIGGFVLGGANENTRVLIRAIGPSLAKFGINGALSDPMLELHDGNGALLQRNNDWRDQQETEIAQTGVAPRDNAEAAILANLAPGAYTAVVSGQNGQTGVALVEVFTLR
jgi:DNA-binding beta-propeller fold protein YncE